ncbi:uncharacterized protein LOC113388988 [Ctenocephalides felis]|uniref:uncharacterized protein LOC113388988 n=1 Tax=Ctenocephalides felis TaxID=7515 RepID=UPI000E6E2E89|nr:uncharacterized protein LOC113388988 [Ctenocephalides felis]
MSKPEKPEQISFPPSQVERVGVKVPPFWPEKTQLWFAQLEGQFALSNISADTTKFYVAIAYLETQYAAEVEDIILKPPTENKYETLKCTLIKRVSMSEDRKLEQLLYREEIGDRRPSQFLRHLRALGGSKVDDSILKILWIRRLPENIQAIISAHDHLELDKIADMADKIADIVLQHKIQGVSKQMPSTSKEMNHTISEQILELQNQNATLNSKIDLLAKQVEALTQAKYRTLPSRSKVVHPSPRGYCQYHSRFGAKARKCNEPCSFKSLNLNDSQ